jgi:hypothetical protein
MNKVEDIKKKVKDNRENIIQFLRDIVAIPSMEGQLKDVGERIQAEMRKLGFDEARFDMMGNTIGRIGNGPKVIVFDSHIDTVGVGDSSEWEWDPFVGKVENGILYARGTCDEKGSTPGMIYGLLLRQHGGMVRWHRAQRLRRGRSPGTTRFRSHRRADQNAGLPRAQGPHRVEDHRQRPVGARCIALSG